MVRMKNINNTGVTLLEILLSSIIFVIAVGGIFATLSAVRAPVANKESALTAAVFGKQVLEALRSQVDAATYYNNCPLNSNGACVDFSLYLGTHQVPHTILPLSWPLVLAAKNTVCDANGCLIYTVSCGDGSTPNGNPPVCGNANVARRVDLNINW